jgi:hypothetical protein
VTAPATSHQSFATSPCGPSDNGSSSPTTDPCENPSRREALAERLVDATTHALEVLPIDNPFWRFYHLHG